MKSLAVNGYTAPQVLAALRGITGVRTVDFRYELLTSAGAVIKTLTNVKKDTGSIDNNSDQAIIRTGKLTVVEDGTINYMSNRVKFYMRLLMPGGGWAEWPLGVFLMTTPTKGVDASGALTRQIEAYDLTLALQTDKVPSRYYVAANAKYTDAIAELLAGTVGLLGSNITTSATVLPAAKEWDPGTPKYDIVTDLTKALNYNNIWFDGNGVAQVTPWIDPNTRTAGYDYSTDAYSVITSDGAQQTLDTFKIPNSWVFYVSNPDRPALRVTRQNVAAASPLSIANRGQTITDYVQIDDAPDLFVLGSIADQKVYDATLIYDIVEFNTALMPMHETFECFTINYGDLAVTGKYVETNWGMTLSAGGKMTHKAQKAVQVL